MARETEEGKIDEEKRKQGKERKVGIKSNNRARNRRENVKSE